MLFLTYKPYLWIIQFQGDSQLKRKDNSSRSPCRRLRARFEVLPQNAQPASGILTWFPFDIGKSSLHVYKRKGFPYILGSSNPWPIAVLMEPFSTSAFKVLIWIFATTTKICTRGSSTKAHAKGFYTVPPRPLTHWSLILNLLQWLSIGSTLQRHQFSGLIHSAGELLHTP
jgi:hypothetical protein